MAFKWSEDQSIHLPEVDAEHRSLYILAAGLKSALSTGVPAPVIEEILQALLEETEDHFLHEERIMREARYAMLPWHKSQHDALRKRADRCAARIHEGEIEAGMELLEYLGRWLPDHMAVADNMMGAALRNYQRSHAA